MSCDWYVVWICFLPRVVYVSLLVLIIVSTADGFRMGYRGHLIPNDNFITVFAGLWFSSALFAFFAVKLVRLVERLWTALHRRVSSSSISTAERAGTAAQVPQNQSGGSRPPSEDSPAPVELVPDPSRRYFFPSASAVAGAAPYISTVYGFSAARLNYQSRHVEIPLANCPPPPTPMQ